MLIKELFDSLNEFDHKHHRALVDRIMSTNGYKKLGQGAESVVYEKDAGNVIKIIVPETGDQTSGRNAHEYFLKFCEADENPHLPRFKESPAPLVLDGEEFKQIMMEKLFPVTDIFTNEILAILAGDDPNSSSYARYKTWKDVLHQELHDYKSHGTEWLSDNAADLSWPTDAQLTKKFGAFFTIAKKLFDESPYRWDLHANNVMQRSNGVLVIADPLFGSS
jgi:hypothetical protein